MSARHLRKLAEAQDPARILECKQRLMELRREAALKLARTEPDALLDLQKVLKEKGDGTVFFQSRVRQAKQRLFELVKLAPAAEEELPAFGRPYKTRTDAEDEAIGKLERAVASAEAGEMVCWQDDDEASASSAHGSMIPP